MSDLYQGDIDVAYIIKPLSGINKGYVYEAENLPGCRAIGATAAEAEYKGQETVRKWLVRASKMGIDALDPDLRRGVTSLRIRVPSEVHEHIINLSERMRVSQNEIVILLLVRSISRRISGEDSICDWAIRPQKLGDAVSKQARSGKDISGGAWVQRFPKALHSQLKIIQELEGVSLNLLINVYLAREVAYLDALSRRMDFDRIACAA